MRLECGKWARLLHGGRRRESKHWFKNIFNLKGKIERKKCALFAFELPNLFYLLLNVCET
jgi:hypothetical protein